MKNSWKILTVLAIVLATGSTVRAQDVYHPITDGCTWSVSNEKYMTVGDTVLGGKTYLKLYRQVENQPFEFDIDYAEYFAAIRDDSAEKKVYAYLPAGTWVYDQFHQLTIIDTGMDVLLYDFTPKLGETLLYYTICPDFNNAQEVFAYRSETAFVVEGYENGTSHYTVYEDSDSLVLMSDGSTRRRILLNITWGVSFYWSEVWIEGIGRIEGFNDRGGFESDNPLRMLLCYTDSTGATYRTGYDFDGSDDCFNNNGYGPGQIPDKVFENITVYPNPVGNTLHIDRFLSDGSYMKLEVISSVGNCLFYEKKTDEKIVLDMKSFPKGVYFLKLETQSRNKIYKIIKS